MGTQVNKIMHNINYTIENGQEFAPLKDFCRYTLLSICDELKDTYNPKNGTYNITKVFRELKENNPKLSKDFFTIVKLFFIDELKKKKKEPSTKVDWIAKAWEDYEENTLKEGEVHKNEVKIVGSDFTFKRINEVGNNEIVTGAKYKHPNNKKRRIIQVTEIRKNSVYKYSYDG